MSWISVRALIACLAVLGGILLFASVGEKLLDNSSLQFFDIALLVVGVSTLLVIVGVVLPRLDKPHTRERLDRQQQEGSLSKMSHARAPARRKWIVVVLSTMVSAAAWVVLIRMGTTISDPGIQPLALFQIPFVSACVATIAVLALGPLRRIDPANRKSADWLPAAIVVTVATLGVLLIPACAMWAFKLPLTFSAYTHELLAGFLLMPLGAVLFSILRPARRP